MKTVNVVTLKKFKYHHELDFYELVQTEKFEVSISKDVYEVIRKEIKKLMPENELVKVEVSIIEKVVGSDMNYSIDNLQKEHRKNKINFTPKNGQKIHI